MPFLALYRYSDIYYDMSEYHHGGGADYFKWIDRVSQVKRHKTIELERLQNEIIRDGSTSYAYFFASEFQYKTYRMQRVILDHKDPKYAYAFALSIPHADIKALQDVVVSSNKIKYITQFACFVKRSDRKLLESIILKSKNVQYAHMFLKHVKNANIKKFRNLILESGKPRYLFELAKHSPSDIELIEDLIIKSGSFIYMRLLAEKVKQANVDKIERAVLATNNGPEIKKFAQCVRRSKMRQFLLVG